jgi:hypothetical protein
VLGTIKKTIIVTKFGIFYWTIMLFGLKNVASTFTRITIEMFQEWMQQFLKVFVDVLNVHNTSWSKHMKHPCMLLTRLMEVNLKLNPNKCVFITKNIKFLGHVINKKGTMFDLLKIKVVDEFSVLVSITNVCAFFGLIKYYKNYIKGYAKFAFPLFELTKKDANFRWVFVCQGVFETLTMALVEARFQQGFHPRCGLVYLGGGNDYVSKGWVEGTCDYLH